MQVLIAADTQSYNRLQESAPYYNDGARRNHRLGKIKHHHIVICMSRQLIQDHARFFCVKTTYLLVGEESYNSV